ncbi:MAG: polyprenyl synthetase family protein [Hyphomicrobiales bacterium]|nr:polyprenyl synthetase family protein [Hyphomicrobiales bacterium]
MLLALTKHDMGRVNENILSHTGSHVKTIPQVANYLIDSGGKRIRPMLMLAAAQLCGYQGDHHIVISTAIEFLHTATLLHDDVVDDSDMRRGKQAARKIWGNENSVLVGDFLLARTFNMMVKTGSLECLNSLSGAAVTISEGEIMQLAAAKNTSTTEDHYLKIIHAKTAALFESACEMGAMISDASEEQRQALHSFGHNLGIAFQLVDDALDFGGGSGLGAQLDKNIGDDFREQKITLPIIFAYREGSMDERNFWDRTLKHGDQKDGDLEHAISLLAKYDTLNKTKLRAEHYASKAVQALALFPESEMRTALEQTVAFCIAREK